MEATRQRHDRRPPATIEQIQREHLQEKHAQAQKNRFAAEPVAHPAVARKTVQK